MPIWKRIGFAIVFVVPALMPLGARSGHRLCRAGRVAACALEIINDVEHDGLSRRRLADGRYERNTHLHRLNADFALTNLLRHSDHHAHASRCYQVLRHRPDSPQLPGGYAAMFVLALFPHLWFRVIHPRLQRWQSGEGAAS